MDREGLMGLGHKHFSHPHKLEMHEMPDGAEVLCSGCNSSATKTIYICSQCNFFLHEQCFHATRSKKHPSHPFHPLTLVPYPTYLSNSFYCNNCKIIGTGFSYSCSDCDFDLHVQCAYSISASTNSHQPNHVTNCHPQNISSANLEKVPPNIHGQNSSLDPHVIIQAPIQVYAQCPTVIPQDPHMAQNAAQIYVPPSTQNPITSNQNAYVSPNVTNFSSNGQNFFESQYPTKINPYSFLDQNVSPFSATYIPATSAQNTYASQNYGNIPTSAHILSISQYPTGITQDSNIASNVSLFHVPSISQNPITTPQKVYTSQNNIIFPGSSQYPPMPQNTTSNFVPSAPSEQQSNFGESGQNIVKRKGIKHFSHPHGLLLVNINYRKKKITCSGCQETLVGKGYACVEENCGFQLDESCFNLMKEIRHKSHPAHLLSLLSSSPYKDGNGMFACGACFRNRTGFTYHCSICEYDLDIKCANLKETVKRDDHQHALKLCYECPLKGEDYTFYCDVCSRVVPPGHWTYYCQKCDYGTHLDCVDREECDNSSGDPNIDASTGEQRLNEAIDIARINALTQQAILELWD